ncbi:proline-rich protein PRCC-like [Watersipora subatra]|uniref:proline-rich protein PRCC-like n=1 Tax=Watersipora subatra TaxID=2589382 RepID=UPI00355B86E8
MALVADYGMSSEESDDEENTTADTTTRITSTATSGDNSDDVLEDFVKKTNYGDSLPEKPPPKLMMANSLSKMRLPNAGKAKIQISIPTLQDSDSDDDEPKQKKTKSTISAAGFLGSLPAPRASGGGGKEVGRAFIPYTMTKKPAESKSTIKPKAHNSVKVKKLAEAYSDSDEEPQHADSNVGTSTNFFSLSSEPENSNVVMTGAVTTYPSEMSNFAGYAEKKTTQPRITAASLYNMSHVEDDSEVTVDQPAYDTSSYSESSTSQVDDLLQNEQFLRLQGKKQRGKETIDIIDVHTDDQKISEMELTKNITEEVVDPAAWAHRKKGDGPSGQQKRKHQITYLAFQAKERELELKNTWAANRSTKQQTQAKYGF